ncbi:MAG: DUF507 family protein [Deltaproteobacteria bacterium]|nr:DUF507 family protein [Deltaproteobacteria bacterium]
MRLYRDRIPLIAKDIVLKLAEDGDIEVENPDEASLDAESVLNEYLRLSIEITEKAKERLISAKLPYSSLGRLKKTLADERGFQFGEEGVRYISVQMVEMFMQSNNIDEIFTEDFELRNKIEPILQKHMSLDDEIDAEVRKRMKNLEEGTTTWDIEYQNTLEKIKVRYGLE